MCMHMGKTILVLATLTLIVSGYLGGQIVKADPLKQISLNAEWRLRYEARECNDFCALNQRDPSDQLSRLRLNFQHSLTPTTSITGRFQHSYRRNTLQGRSDAQDRTGFQQLYVDTQAGDWNLRFGRQDLGYGDYRVLIFSNWDNIGFTWDAARLRLKSPKWQTDLLYGRPGMFPSHSTHPVLYGVYSTWKPASSWASDLYLLRKEVIASGTQHRIWALGARPQVTLNQSTKLAAEAVLQRGEVGDKNLKAWGYWVRVEYMLPRTTATKLVVQHDFASGGSPDATELHTFDQFFGTTFAICGRMGLQGWRNLRAWRIGLAGSPSKQWQYTADVHFNRLANARDHWYGGSGAPMRGADGKVLRDPLGTAGNDVGTEMSLTLTYNARADLQISVGYGRFMPGGFVRATNKGFADQSEWFYLQTTQRY